MEGGRHYGYWRQEQPRPILSAIPSIVPNTAIPTRHTICPQYLSLAYCLQSLPDMQFVTCICQSGTLQYLPLEQYSSIIPIRRVVCHQHHQQRAGVKLLALALAKCFQCNIEQLEVLAFTSTWAILSAFTISHFHSFSLLQCDTFILLHIHSFTVQFFESKSLY